MLCNTSASSVRLVWQGATFSAMKRSSSARRSRSARARTSWAGPGRRRRERREFGGSWRRCVPARRSRTSRASRQSQGSSRSSGGRRAIASQRSHLTTSPGRSTVPHTPSVYCPRVRMRLLRGWNFTMMRRPRHADSFTQRVSGRGSRSAVQTDPLPISLCCCDTYPLP